MAHRAFLFSVACALVLTGCMKAPNGGAGDNKQLAELQKQVAAAQQANKDLRTKIAARLAVTGDPLDDFFNAPEFWQCTYDSGWSDCANRCTKATSDGYKACIANNPPGPARQQCVNENAQRGSNCLKNCPVPNPDSGLSTCFM